MKFKTAVIFLFFLMGILLMETTSTWAQSPPNPGLSNAAESKPEKPAKNTSDFFTAKDKSEAESMCNDFARESGNSKCVPVRSYKAPGQWYCECSK